MTASTVRPAPGRRARLIRVTTVALLAGPSSLSLLSLTVLPLPVASLTGAVAQAAPGHPGPSTRPWRWPLPRPGSSGPAHSGGVPGAVPGAVPEVVRGFDPPDGPYGRGHRGVDLAAAPGTPVLAAGAGVVGHAGPLAGRGVVTVVHPDGLRTTYEPVRALVRPGQHVWPGTVLGTLEPGHPGCSRPACLHWGLLRGNRYRDPLSLLWHGPVRLLPLAQIPPDRGAPHPVRRSEPGARPEAEPSATGDRRPSVPPWTRSGTVAALGLAVAGGLVLSRRRPP